MKLQDAVILVTGGAHRVGKSISMTLAAEKARVAFTYNSSNEAAARTLAELQALGVDALAVRCDQSDQAQIHQTIEQTLKHFGRLDGLVNSASIWQDKPFLETTAEDWETTLAINTRGPFFFTQAAARVMLAREGGSIVNIVDGSAFTPVQMGVHHGISKTGLWMLTRSSALALAPKIRVNAVSPGPVLIPQGWSEERWQSLAESIPLKRLGTPEDVARAVVYLMKEDFITGQTICVDGGSTNMG
ncbi:MAG: SDR family oxidoreductase [Anaerolineae bacterium]|nr:SDR family oxidoreductase [Anaerolineae bacterium]